MIDLQDWPADWGRVTLQCLADITMGQSPPSSTYNDFGDGLPFLQGKAEFGTVYPTPIKWCNSPRKKVNEGEILISVRAPVGDVNFANQNLCIGRGLAGIKAKNDVEPWFLFFLLHSAKNEFEVRSTGTTFKSINKSTLYSFQVPNPPKNEQAYIAHILCTVQQAKEATGKVITAARQLKASLMKHLFTYGPVPFDQADKVLLKETKIGLMPEHWALETFGNHIDIKSGQVDPRDEPYNDMIHIGPENIESGTGRILQPKTCREVGLISGKYLFTQDDVIYSKIRPYLRKVALPSATGLCSADMYPLRPKNQIKKKFLYFWLLTPQFTVQAVSHQSRTGIPKINRQQLDSTLIPLPPPDEQEIMTDWITRISNKIDSELVKNETLGLLFQSLLHHLMTGKVRVKDISLE